MRPVSVFLVGLWLAACSSWSAAHHATVIEHEFDNRFIPTTYPHNLEMMNETEIEALIQLEKEELEYYEGLAERRDFLEDWRGDCFCKDDVISCGCCAQVKVRGSNKKACFKATITPEHLKLTLSLDYQDETLLSIDIAPTEFCAFIPWTFRAFQLCIVAYHLYVGPLAKDKLPDADFKLCLQLDLVIFTPVLSVDFNCLVMNDGEIYIDNSVTTYRPGIVAININKGNPKVSFNNPFDAKSALLSKLPTVHVNKIKQNVEKTVNKLKKIENKT